VEVVKTNQCKLLTLSCSPWDRVQLLGINRGTENIIPTQQSQAPTTGDSTGIV